MSRSLSDAIRAGNVAEVKSKSSDAPGFSAAGLVVVVNLMLWHYTDYFIGIDVKLEKHVTEKGQQIMM